MKIDFNEAYIVKDFHDFRGHPGEYFLVCRDEDSYYNIIDKR